MTGTLAVVDVVIVVPCAHHQVETRAVLRDNREIIPCRRLSDTDLEGEDDSNKVIVQRGVRTNIESSLEVQPG